MRREAPDCEAEPWGRNWTTEGDKSNFGRKGWTVRRVVRPKLDLSPLDRAKGQRKGIRPIAAGSARLRGSALGPKLDDGRG